MGTTQQDEVNVFIGVRSSEWRFVFLICLTVLGITSLPYLFGYLIHPDDAVFMGIVYGVSDTAQYFSWLRGFQDRFFIDNHLTPEPNAAVFMNLQWWLLAQFMRISGLGYLQVFHVLRVLAALSFAVVVYWFISLCVTEQRQRRIAFLIVQFGGGVGWFWVVVKYATGSADVAFPFDLYTIEPNSFLSQMSFPHFTMAAALIVAVLGTMARAIESGQWRLTWVACALTLVLGLSHAYDLLLVYVIISLYVLCFWIRDGFSWTSVWQMLVWGSVTCGPALYSVYMTSDRFPVWHDVLAQFDLAGAWTPDPFHLLFLLGIPFVLALLGSDGLTSVQRHSLPQVLVRAWFVANLFLVYLPLNFQIHYLNGWQVPIAILATEAVCDRVVPAVARWSTRNAATIARWLPVVFVLAVLPTNVYLLAWRFLDLKRYEYPYFVHRDEDAALDWLAQHADEEDVVLCARAWGQYVPMRTGARPFLGHWAMTKDLYEKREILSTFYDPMTPDDVRKAILSEFSVDYVFWGVVERQVGDFDPSRASYLVACYAEPEASIFCVKEAQ